MSDNRNPMRRRVRRVSKEQLEDWKVLIVDDQPDNLLVAEAALKFHNATTHKANNGLEGLEALKSFQPTLILLDLSMPEMDGWDMLEELKKRPEMETIPIIALTAHVMQGDKERVLAAGFTGYIPKPFSVSTLVQQIKQILETANT